MAESLGQLIFKKIRETERQQSLKMAESLSQLILYKLLRIWETAEPENGGEYWLSSTKLKYITNCTTKYNNQKRRKKYIAKL